MIDLEAFEAKLCMTAVGMCIYQKKVLMVHHKKAGIWLSPGGHVEKNELPHRAAEREFWEETGLRVKAFDLNASIDEHVSQYVPNPILTNLHWINRDNYDKRLENKDTDKRVVSDLFPLGCEQHYSLVYLVKLQGENTQTNALLKEVHEARWFGEDDIAGINTDQEIKDEVMMVFELFGKRG